MEPAPSPPRPFASITRARLLVAAIAVCTVGSLVYSNTLGVPFVFDDRRYIERNTHLRLTSLGPRELADAAFRSPIPSRALANASFALNHYVGGLDVTGYHLVNIAIHLINGMLVYLLTHVTLVLARRQAGGLSPPDQSAVHLAALVAALVFVAHPVQSQACSG
jgi:hypothetical protein